MRNKLFMLLILLIFSIPIKANQGYNYCVNIFPEKYPECTNGGCNEPAEPMGYCILHNCHRHNGEEFDHDCNKKFN